MNQDLQYDVGKTDDNASDKSIKNLSIVEKSAKPKKLILTKSKKSNLAHFKMPGLNKSKKQDLTKFQKIRCCKS